eukprot:NODE_140_length_3474_cov_54.174575_g119_i0.p1 GENE.NODE_140_length_3474_cov_54.174575_g119_i0~~NODE_140_length_3474_cov_54.174575_g119_i0.p1  ORF type:complete len:1079 (+),score=155.47 NODE_140_length_3474_cov_54.174575_g119_i0:51-3287(+)
MNVHNDSMFTQNVHWGRERTSKRVDSPKNIGLIISESRTKGRTPRTWHSLTNTISRNIVKRLDEDYHDVPSTLLELANACVHIDSRKVRQVLSEISRMVCQSQRPVLRRIFVVCGGIDYVLPLLFIDTPWLRQSPWIGPIWNMCLRILKDLSQSLGPQVPQYIYKRDPNILKRTFAMMHYKTTFEAAASLTEDILSATGTVVDLEVEFPTFVALMNKLCVKHRALFCRVVALFLYSSNLNKNAQFRYSEHFEKQQGKEADSIIDRNHNLLIDDPHLLAKIVNLLKYQINVIDSLQYGNFLALLVSVNDEPSTNGQAQNEQPPINEETPLQDVGTSISNTITRATPFTGFPTYNIEIEHSSTIEPRESTTNNTNPLDNNQSTTGSPSNMGWATPLLSALLAALAAIPAAFPNSNGNSNGNPNTFSSILNSTTTNTTTTPTADPPSLPNIRSSSPSRAVNYFPRRSSLSDEPREYPRLSLNSPIIRNSLCLRRGSPTRNNPLPSTTERPNSGFAGVTSTNSLARSSLLEYLDGTSNEDVEYGNSRRLSLQSLTVVSCQVDVLFVLSSLLSGKRKVEVRERMTRLKLLNTLNDIFDYIFWEKKRTLNPQSFSSLASALGVPEVPPTEPAPNSEPINTTTTTNTEAQPQPPQPQRANIHSFNSAHPADCDCRPESARRIQFLRLVHKYCDCSDHFNLHNADPETRFSKHKLARRIVGCLLKNKADSSCRYWLASCLEAVLRGNHWQYRIDDQISVAEQDLLPHLVKDVAYGMEEGHTTTRLQSSFDLLAELIKFNRQLFIQFNKIIEADIMLYHKLCQTICTQLVHSNIFLRFVILSLNYFQPNSILRQYSINESASLGFPIVAEDDLYTRIQSAKHFVQHEPTSSPIFSRRKPEELVEHLDLRESPVSSFSSQSSFSFIELTEKYQYESCLLTAFIKQHKVEIIRNLMIEIDLDQINKDNICCINTALVFFIFAHEASCLRILLQNIYDFERKQSMVYLDYSRSECSINNEDQSKDIWYDLIGRRCPFRNFDNLMRYWIVYYNGHTQDTETLFHSSRIPWSKWRSVVDVLLEFLPNYYLSP